MSELPGVAPSRDDRSGPLIVHIIFRLDYGGLENGLINLINRLSAEATYRHAIVALTESTEFSRRLKREIPIYALGKRPGRDFGAYVRLYRLLRRLRPAVVHTRNVGTMDCALVAFLARVPVRVHGEHGWDVFDPDGLKLKYLIFRRLLSLFVHRFVVVTDDLFRWLTTIVGISAGRVIRIHNGVDTDKFRPPQPGERLDPVYAPAAGTLVVGSVTRFSAIKNPLALVEAFVRLRAQGGASGDALRLLMVGDGELRPAALVRIENAGAAGHAFLPGSRDDISSLLRCMHMFVLGSLREGMSNTILEAMASGLPVIATATGGNLTLVADRESGFLVEPGDADALMNAIRSYADDELLRTQHGRRAREIVVSKFSISAMVDQYRRLYERVLPVDERR